MIEVVEDDAGGWTWRMICPAGRPLVVRGGFTSQLAAIVDARRYRAAFFSVAARIDHRQGACI